MGDRHDHYATLGVDPTATTDQIDRAFRQRAKEEHPDHGGDPDAFMRLREAYAVLRDPDLRRRYDEGVIIDIDPDPDPWDREEHWGRRAGPPSPPPWDERGRPPSTERTPGMPPPPAPPPAPWTVPAGPAAASTNPWATAAVVLMFIPFLAPLAVASAIVALQQISASGGMQRGRMRSIVVLVVSAVPAFSVVSQLLG